MCKGRILAEDALISSSRILVRVIISVSYQAELGSSTSPNPKPSTHGRTLAAEEGGLYEATLRDYRRKALTIFIWAGFAVLTIWATKPIWNYAIFGFNPILDDLLSITCF
jgi:hypothetical protein